MSFPSDPGTGDPLQRLPGLNDRGLIPEQYMPKQQQLFPLPVSVPFPAPHEVDERVYEVQEVLNKPIEVVIRIPFKNKEGNDCALILTEAEAYKLYESLSAALGIK